MIDKSGEDFLEKAKAFGSTLGLLNMKRLMEELLNVQEELKIIHVAGTNGKGSVCAMLASILKEGGYKTGMYTSPMVFTREEQYLIHGIPIGSKRLNMVIEQIKMACECMLSKGFEHPTIFEIETAAAFLLFYQEKCDVVILETGLGGEGDATNIILKPLCSVFTSIGMDHMGFLGNSLEEIAKVKAGIIKENCSVITVSQKDEVIQVLEKECKLKNSKMQTALVDHAYNIWMDGNKLTFSYGHMEEIKLSLTGAYQIKNCITAIEVVRNLSAQGYLIDEKTLRRGLLKAKWPGRYEIVSDKPVVIIDGAHNEDAAKSLRETLQRDYSNEKLIFIIGMLEDKKRDKILADMLPLADKVYTVTPNHKRALNGEILADEASLLHDDVTYKISICDAFYEAYSKAKINKSIVVAFGSLSYLKEIKTAFKKEEKK